MKSIMISIKPKWVAKILNGEKTIEIRKTMPKCDLPIDVYIYCTKEEELYKFSWNKTWYENFKCFTDMGCDQAHALDSDNLSGKVVAKFTLNKVEEIKYSSYSEIYYIDESYEKSTTRIFIDSCLTLDELDDYSQGKSTYAWHISNLVIFDKSKELSEFGVKRSPQSWQFIEVGD